jgi:hypothetical protein
VRGNSQPHREAYPGEQSSRATENSSNGDAEGREIRGNSKARRRYIPKVRNAGKPAIPIERSCQEERSSGVTRKLQRQRRQRMRESGQPETASRERVLCAQPG